MTTPPNKRADRSQEGIYVSEVDLDTLMTGYADSAALEPPVGSLAFSISPQDEGAIFHKNFANLTMDQLVHQLEQVRVESLEEPPLVDKCGEALVGRPVVPVTQESPVHQASLTESPAP